jgi:hypothetical protein
MEIDSDRKVSPVIVFPEEGGLSEGPTFDENLLIGSEDAGN